MNTRLLFLKSILIVSFEIFIILSGFAQEVKINGTVRDHLNNGIDRVKVFYDGTSDTVYTDSNGKFSISVDSNTLELDFIKEGYKPASASIGILNEMDISMGEEGSDIFSDISLYDLMNMEITSVSKKAERLQDVPSSISVITAEDIERSSAQNLMQLLREQVTGFWGVANDYKDGDGFIRNTYEGSVLVLLDGTSLLDLNYFSFDYESFDIPFNQIERIEVIKGSGGTVYGANSASGVISIITKKASNQNKLYVSADYSLPGQTEGDLIYTPLKSGPLKATIYGKYSLFKGFRQMDVIENSTSEVPVTFGTGTTTITNRFTGDDNTFSSLSAGLNLDYDLSEKLKISSSIHMTKVKADKYYQIYSREKSGFVLRDNEVRPFSVDSVYLGKNNKTRIVGNIRSDYTFNEKHSVFARVSMNNEDQTYFVGGGSHANNGIVDFELQDNFQIKFNYFSVGANYRMVNYNLENPSYSSVTYINPDAKEAIFGFFLQDKISLLEGKLNFYLGAKAENFSLINSNFYLSPMAKFTIIPSDKITIWGGYTESYTTPGFNQTNIEFDIFKAYSSTLYPIFYNQAQQAIFQQVYQTGIASGADAATATANAEAYIASPEGIQQIEGFTNSQLNLRYPGGNVNFTAINGPNTVPTSFKNFEIGIRGKPLVQLSLETNFYYSLMDNGVGSAPADVGTIKSPTRPGENILSYYYGNYITGYNLGLETIIKYKPLSKLLIEISHNYFQYFIEYKKNEDFDINALSDSQRDLVDEEYPLLPKNTFRAKIYYDILDHLRFSLSTTYSTAFFSRYSNIYSTYQYEQQRFDPLYADGGNQKLIGGKFDNRFILNFKIEKSFLEDKLCLYVFGYDITSSPFVEGINQLNNVYPRQVGGLYGVGLSYSIP